jgi:hypothetical protein
MEERWSRDTAEKGRRKTYTVSNVSEASGPDIRLGKPDLELNLGDIRRVDPSAETTKSGEVGDGGAVFDCQNGGRKRGRSGKWTDG